MPSVELRNPALERMRAGDVALGMLVRLGRSGDIARIAKTTGHDFIFLDVQHAIYSLETIGHIAQAALGVGVAPLVRVRSAHDPDIALMLDCGATGIVVPDVNTVADAQTAVATCKFAPVGRRSVGGLYPALDFKTAEKASGNTIRQAVALRQGIDAELARRLVREIKDSKLKVQVAIQGSELRVSGKKRDDLQAAIAVMRGLKIEQPLQYLNFRE